MQTVARKTIRMVMKIARTVALLLAVGATGSAWAAASPKATVVWNGDFGTTEKTGYDGNTYTFTLNPTGNTGDNLNTLSGGTDGNLVIGSGSTYGGQIAWPVDKTSATVASVLVKYSSLAVTDKSTTPVLASVTADQYQNNAASVTAIIDDCVAVKTAGGSKLTGRFGSGSNQNYGGELADIKEPSGYILMVFTGGSAFQFWTSSDGETWSGGTASGLTFGTTFPSGVGLGGMSGRATANGQAATADMTIEAVAIFRGYSVSTSDISTYSLLGYFSSSSYEKWYYAKDVFTWHSDNGTQSDIGSSSSKVTVFSPTAGTDTGTSYACGGNTGYSGSTFWHTFCYGQTSYTTPGCALRVTSAHASKQIKATYNPLTLGGLIIESGANGVDFYNDTGSRQTILGAATGNKETWFGIYDNATISRSGYLKLSGTVNLEVSKGKTFTISAANSPTIVEALTATDGTSTSGGALKMHGLGKLAVSTLTATGGATLDFSDVQEDAEVVRSTTPFIQGNLTIDSTTKFVFPAGLAKETAYTLCSGTLTGPTEMITDITVGTTVIKNVPLTFSGNTVSYGDPVYAATVDGTTVTWDGDEPESYDGIVVTFSGSGTVEGLSGTGTTINAADGVTVDVTNFTSPTLLGAGTFRWTANYPTTVPTGDFSYEYVGTGASTEIANVTANGYLKTSGNIALASFTLSSGATLEVESGMTMVQAKQQLALSGNITVDSGATFSNLQTANGYNADAVNYNQQGMKIIVYGTLAMGSTRWSLRQKSYHEFRLYDGAQITGTGDGDGALDWIENCGGQLDTYGGTVTISANMRVRSGATTANWVASDATCKFTGSTWGAGGFSKSGAGTLSFEGTHTQTGSVSASDGTIALNNISMTSSIITLSSASASPTLKMIATESSTTVSATVSVPANTRGTLAFEGAGTFALNGPNTSGNIVWLSSNPVPGALQLNGNVNINNGSRGSSYVINKIASGTGNLGLTAWTGTYDNNDTALTYTINTIAADDYSGTIALANKSTDNRASTFNFSIGDIVGTATYGTPLVKLTKSISAKGENATGENTINVNISSTTFNGGTATFLYDDTANAEGIYLAEASYNGTPYKTLDLAVAAMETAEGDPADVIVYNSAATIPFGYGLVTPASGNMTLRRAGDIYYTSGYWSSTENSFAVVTSGGVATSVASGDTVVIDSTHASSVSQAWVADTFPANAADVRVAKNFTFHSGVSAAIFGGVTIAVDSGYTLTLNNSNSQNAITLGAATLNGPGAVVIGDNMPVSGAVTGTASITIGANKIVTVASTGSIANALVLASGATLVVQSGATVPTPTSGVSGYIVQSATSDGTTTYSLAEQITVGGDEVGYMDNTTAVITNTAAAVTVPASAQAVELAFSTGSEITLTSTTTLTTDNVTVYATDANGVKDTTYNISSAFKVAGENNTYTISLDGSATVNDVKVQPETAEDSPMTFTGSSPSFTVKTIPGLWYQVLAADSVDDGALVSPVGGTAVQATTSTVSPAAPAFTGTVKFYKIAVGASKAALQ